MKVHSAMINRIENSEVFNKLQIEIEDPSEMYSGPADVLDIFEQFLFIWDCKNQSIHVINLNYEESGKHGAESQTLLLTSPPLGAVTQLLVSPAGQRIVLVSQNDVTVAEMPSRWGKHWLFEGGKREVLCTSHHLAERFFLCNRHAQVSKVRWHPESLTDSHLVVLCSDNYLRVFDLAADLQTPRHVIALGATHSASLGARAGSASFVRSLGEVAVSFTFGPRLPPSEGQDPEKQEPLPVYILRGNGDIYITCINLDSPSGRFQVLGPVTMHPAADDNYGTDACDLLCVGGSPAVLVVATPTRFYHCIVLAKQPDEDDGVCSEDSQSRFSANFSLEPAAVSLYVYESVEPSLVLAPGEDDDSVASPVRLHPDPASHCRYFCSHAAGVHAVAMPVIPALERFAAERDGSEEPLGEHECIVEHLVSTRPLSSSPECPVIGLVIVPHPLTMVVLLATHQVVARPLLARYRPPPEPADVTAAVGQTQEPGDQFLSHVRRLLERADSVPVVRSAADSAPAAERLQLLTRAASLLRHEYLRKQDLARDALRMRCDALRSLLIQQREDTTTLSERREELLARAEQQAETCRRLTENRQRLAERAEAVVRRCEQGIPVLSDAEKAVVRELKALGDVSELQQRLDALRAKHQYQKRQASVLEANERRRDRQLASLTAAQRQLLSTELAAQGDQIAGLISQVQAARRTLAL